MYGESSKEFFYSELEGTGHEERQAEAQFFSNFVQQGSFVVQTVFRFFCVLLVEWRNFHSELDQKFPKPTSYLAQSFQESIHQATYFQLLQAVCAGLGKDISKLLDGVQTSPPASRRGSTSNAASSSAAPRGHIGLVDPEQDVLVDTGYEGGSALSTQQRPGPLLSRQGGSTLNRSTAAVADDGDEKWKKIGAHLESHAHDHLLESRVNREYKESLEQDYYSRTKYGHLEDQGRKLELSGYASSPINQKIAFVERYMEAERKESLLGVGADESSPLSRESSTQSEKPSISLMHAFQKLMAQKATQKKEEGEIGQRCLFTRSISEPLQGGKTMWCAEKGGLVWSSETSPVIVEENTENFPHGIQQGPPAAQQHDRSLTRADRLLAFACVEGLMFSSSFAFLFRLKTDQFSVLPTYKHENKQSWFPALTQSNDFICRDEGLHTKLAIVLLKREIQKAMRVEVERKREMLLKNEGVDVDSFFLQDSSSQWLALFHLRAFDIVTSALEIELAFVKDVMGGQDLESLRVIEMQNYVRFQAQRLIVSIFGEFPKSMMQRLFYPHENASSWGASLVEKNPLPTMEMLGAQIREDQMSRRGTVYVNDARPVDWARIESTGTTSPPLSWENYRSQFAKLGLGGLLETNLPSGKQQKSESSEVSGLLDEGRTGVKNFDTPLLHPHGGGVRVPSVGVSSPLEECTWCSG